jgi:hypothetical protein
MVKYGPNPWSIFCVCFSSLRAFQLYIGDMRIKTFVLCSYEPKGPFGANQSQLSAFCTVPYTLPYFTISMVRNHKYCSTPYNRTVPYNRTPYWHNTGCSVATCDCVCVLVALCHTLVSGSEMAKTKFICSILRWAFTKQLGINITLEVGCPS